MKQKIDNDNIFMDQPSGELTFGKIFKVLKCSLLRMLVYVLIACVIASSIALVITVTTKTEPTVSTTIRYTHKGIDTGLGPDEQLFSVDRIKSINVLNDALIAAGLDNVEDLDAASLSPNIRIEGIIPSDIYAKIEDLKAEANKDGSTNEELIKLLYFPANYTLKFVSFDKFNLTEEQAISLLDNIIKAYQRDWNNQYNPSPNVPTTIFEQILAPGEPSYEYVDYEDILATHITLLNKLINRYSKSTFVSRQNDAVDATRVENVSYTSLVAELESIKKDVDVFNSYVLINKVYKEVGNVKAPLLNSKEIYEKRLTILKDEKTDIENQIKLINDAMKNSSSIITRPDGSTETVRNFPEAFNEWQKRLMKNIDNISECNTMLADINRKLALIPSEPTSAEHLTYADTLLENISTNFIKLINKSQKYVDDYNDQGIITDDVVRTTPISRSNRATTSNKLILVVFLVAAVVAIIASISVTVSKQKAFAFKKRAALQEEAVAQDTPEVEDETPSDNE